MLPRTLAALLLAATPIVCQPQFPSYLVRTVVGSTPTLTSPAGLALDAAGNLYIADPAADRVMKRTPDGIESVFAGTGKTGFSGDGGPATQALLDTPIGVALDSAGNVYISVKGHIRCVSPDGTITTLALSGSATLVQPAGMAADTGGNLWVADMETHTVRQIDPSGTVKIVAGTGSSGYGGDGGPATEAKLNVPTAVSLDAAGNLYIADSENNRIRKVTPDGIISTAAGDGIYGGFSSSGPVPTEASLSYPHAAIVDAAGNLFISDMGQSQVRKISPSGSISIFAGNGRCQDEQGGDGGPARQATVCFPEGLALDSAGTLFIASRRWVRAVSPAGIISTAAGNYGILGDGGPATAALLSSPSSLSFDGAGNLYFTDRENKRLRKVDPSGIVTTVTDGNASGAFCDPQGVAALADGSVYMSDQCSGLLKLGSDGAMTRVGSNGGFGGDGGPVTAATFQYPDFLCADANGNLYIADVVNHRLRKVAPDGTITTIAGNGKSGSSGDGGPAVAAALTPGAIAVDSAGTVYVVDQTQYTIRAISPSGTISTVAGGGKSDLDGVPATSANLPMSGLMYGLGGSLAVDASGNLLISGESETIRMVAGGIIRTVAGNGKQGYDGDGGPALSARLNLPRGMAVDRNGIIWFADTQNNRIRALYPDVLREVQMVSGDGQIGDLGRTIGESLVVRVVDEAGSAVPAVPVAFAVSSGSGVVTASPVFTGPDGTAASRVIPGQEGTLTVSASVPGLNAANFTVQGVTHGSAANSPGARAGYSISTVAGSYALGDGGPAAKAMLYGPQGIAFDGSGNLYIADYGNFRVRRMTPAGIISTVAGDGSQGYSGNGGSAVTARLWSPYAIAADAAGNRYVTDRGGVRKISADGTIATVAGGWAIGFSGDGGPASDAAFYTPRALVFDKSGNLYVADTYNDRVRKIATDGVVTTVAGNGVRGFSGDKGKATSASLETPQGLALDAAGNLYIAEGHQIRKVSPDGTIVTVAGNGKSGSGGENVSATSVGFGYTAGVAVDAAGVLYFVDTLGRVRKVSASGTVTTVAGGGTEYADSGTATKAALDAPFGLALDAAGSLLCAESNRIRKIAPDGTISTLAGASHYGGDGGPAASAVLQRPAGLAIDSNGKLYFADSGNHRVRTVDRSGNIATAAGTGVAGRSGDSHAATGAQLYTPLDVSTDKAGNVYIADSRNNQVRVIRASGNIEPFAGTGTAGPGGGDGGPAASAQLYTVTSVAAAPDGSVYLADYNYRVRRVRPNGKIETVAGKGTMGFAGDGGPAMAASLTFVTGMAVDPAGNLYLALPGDNRIRKVDTNGIITTFAGTGVTGFSGDGGLATAATLYSPQAVTVDGAGNVFIADRFNHRIRMVTPDGIIATIAGSATTGFSGDGGAATAAELSAPFGLTVGPDGAIYFSDQGNHRVRALVPAK
jgi:sugar lactone lactonase YvrE